MVSNFDRIYAEIQKQAERIAPEHNLDKNQIVHLIMRIADIVDEHSVKHNPRMNQDIQACIRGVQR